MCFAEEFWRKVAGRSCDSLGFHVFADFGGEAVIDDDSRSCAVSHHDVTQLDVPVRVGMRMHELEPA